MQNAVEVVVPLRTNGCPHRKAAWKWCRKQHVYPVTAAVSKGPWRKALGVIPAVERSKADIIVLADADVYCSDVPGAVVAVQNGAAWARPHRYVIRLTEAGTKAYVAGTRWEDCELDRLPYANGPDGGGLLVAHRETLLEVPMDPRFVDWGSEDWAHGFALTTIKGPPWKGDADLIHLWHPPQFREAGNKHGSDENRALWQRYHNARSFPDKMNQLLQEARESFGVDESPMSNHASNLVGQH